MGNEYGTSTLEVHFDGGFDHRGPYGSWEVLFNGFRKTVSRERYLDITSNGAEYMALIGALSWLQSVKFKEQYAVEMWGDSMLVVNQVKGRWRVHKPHLLPMRDKCRSLLKDFGDWQIRWERRHNNVKRFGH